MTVVDPNLIVGRCPFRPIPSSVEDLARLRSTAGLTRAIGTGFDSLLFFDPIAGLASDLARYEPLAAWLSFYAVINPEFPQLEKQITDAAHNPRIAGLRLFPTLHRFELTSERVMQTAELAARNHLTLTLTARLFDGRVAPRYLNQGVLTAVELKGFLERMPADLSVILSMFFFNELQAIDVDWHALPNVGLDLGCCKPNAVSFDQLTSWFPVDRVVLGTGAPFYYWKGARLALAGARLTDEQKHAVLGGNAKRIFQWT